MKCLICGCTDDNCSACLALTGEPCGWSYFVGYGGVCSACNDSAPKLGRYRSSRGRLTKLGWAWASGRRAAAAGRQRRTRSWRGACLTAWREGYDLFHATNRTVAWANGRRLIRRGGSKERRAGRR